MTGWDWSPGGWNLAAAWAGGMVTNVIPPANPLLAGRYRLDSRIATGGMGEVWRATDIVLHRPVAVKLLPIDYRESAGALARFRAEARHAGSLSHPGIAQIYDYREGEPGYAPYLVMELVEGPSLAGLLAGGPLDPARTMDVVAQTAAGLQAAHSAGLVHRDIKPGNLLIGPGGRVKITDFGISRTAASPAMTAAGALIGSPAYLAPERVRGAPATPASDLYALGIVAYECLTGAPPFGGTALEMAYAHVNQPIPALPRQVPPEVAGLVAQLTAGDPAARPGSADEVAQRAGYLREQAQQSWTRQMTTVPPAFPQAGEHPTLHELRVPAVAPGIPVRGPSRTWLRVAAGLAAAGIAVVAVLAGWQLRGAAGSPAAQHPSTQDSSAQANPGPSGTPSANLVQVDVQSLVGQPVDQVRRQLSQLGLQPRVQWQQPSDQQPSDQQQPGTVISVQPSGPVPAGSVVVLTAIQPRDGNGRN